MTALSINRLAALPREARLRLALKLDAAVTGANGAAYVAAAGPLEDLLGLSPVLLRSLGAFLLAFAAAVWIVGSRESVSGAAVSAVIEINAAWVAGSLAFLALGASSPTTVGGVWIAMQAAVVAGFAALALMARRPG